MILHHHLLTLSLVKSSNLGRREPTFSISTCLLSNFSLRPPAAQSRQKKHICDYSTCPASFTRHRDLIRHQKAKHEDSKPFECNFHNCKRGPGNGFSRRDHLNVHIERVHSSLRLKSLEAGASDSDAAPRGFSSQDPPIDFNMGSETATAHIVTPNHRTSTLPPPNYTTNLNTFDNVEDHVRDAGNHLPLREYTHSASQILSLFEPNHPSQMQGQIGYLGKDPSTMQQLGVFDSGTPESTLDDLLDAITNYQRSVMG